MNNSKKYEIIVKIKELMIETAPKNIEEIKDIHKISLNASKVMQLVYSEPILNKFFEEKVEIFVELQKDKEKYLNALELWQQILKEYQPFADFEIKLKYKVYTSKEYMEFIKSFTKTNIEKEIFEKQQLNRFDNFTIDLANSGIDEIVFNTIETYYEYKINIFDFINTIFSKLEELRFNEKEVYNFDENLSNRFTPWDSDEYTRNIYKYYDYIYLRQCENLSFLDMSVNTSYLIVAYTKVLRELLLRAYCIDLSEEQKQEIAKNKEKQQKLERDRLKLKKYPPKLMIFNQICANGNIKAQTIAKNISEIRNKKMSKSTVYNHIRNNGNQKGIVMILTGKDGSLTDLQEYIDNQYSNYSN